MDIAYYVATEVVNHDEAVKFFTENAAEFTPSSIVALWGHPSDYINPKAFASDSRSVFARYKAMNALAKPSGG
ncbi:hypothetical protein KY316_02010, partial [Candidatus Woesearchaeota archaeon]|nr:hypothetical protein [Candidatus Woesearchaeota archaeon]